MLALESGSIHGATTQPGPAIEETWAAFTAGVRSAGRSWQRASSMPGEPRRRRPRKPGKGFARGWGALAQRRLQVLRLRRHCAAGRSRWSTNEADRDHFGERRKREDLSPHGGPGRVRLERARARRGVDRDDLTRKAAAELEGRARRALLKAGFNEAAQRLAASRIGTVNSVCARLVADAAFDLGLSPDVRVLDADQATAALRRAYHDILTLDEMDELAALEQQLIDFEWEERIFTRFRISPERTVSAARNSRSRPGGATSHSSGFWGSPAKDGAALDQALAEGLPGVRQERCGLGKA